MPNLIQTLQNQDPGYWRVVAELWGRALQSSDPGTEAEHLADLILHPEAVWRLLDSFPQEARRALDDLQQNSGRIPWAFFTRRYGPLREMGAGRRDREQPHREPISTTEFLWYRALLGRAFFDAPGGPDEFAYVPADLLPLLPAPEPGGDGHLGRPASPAERARPILATDWILDDACTLLAALRLGLEGADIPLALAQSACPPTVRALQALLGEAGLLDPNGLPAAAPLRAFLEASRGEALARLVQAWLASQVFNELALIPELSLEGEWANDPRGPRQAILGFLSGLPSGEWWSLQALVDAVRRVKPDYQRPAGDYDSWYIRRRDSGEYLRGFEHWDQVDGALIRFTVCGPLHWLGIVDLAFPVLVQVSQPSQTPATSSRPDGPSVRPAAFRLTKWARGLLDGKAPRLRPEEDKLYARSDGRLRLSRWVPRAVRYQVARFCAWEGLKENDYRYRITPRALEGARRQDLQTGQLRALLRRHAVAVPPSLVTALEHWEARGTQARLERVLILRLSSPEVLQQLRASPAARFLGDPLGPTAVIVKPGAAEKVLSALAEMGYLGQFEE